MKFEKEKISKEILKYVKKEKPIQKLATLTTTLKQKKKKFDDLTFQKIKIENIRIQKTIQHHKNKLSSSPNFNLYSQITSLKQKIGQQTSKMEGELTNIENSLKKELNQKKTLRNFQFIAKQKQISSFLSSYSSQLKSVQDQFDHSISDSQKMEIENKDQIGQLNERLSTLISLHSSLSSRLLSIQEREGDLLHQENQLLLLSSSIQSSLSLLSDLENEIGKLKKEKEDENKQNDQMKEEKEKIMESYDQLFFEKEKEIKNKLDQQQSVFDQQIKDQIETLGQMKRKIKNIVDQQPLILSSNSSLLLLREEQKKKFEEMLEKIEKEKEAVKLQREKEVKSFQTLYSTQISLLSSKLNQ